MSRPDSSASKGEAKVDKVQVDEKSLTEEEGVGRYAAYTSRLARIFNAAQRYTAFSSDVGEAFRPVVSPNVVKASYAVSWAYVLGDVSYATYQEHQRSGSTKETVAYVASERATFQSLASMLLPAAFIHTAVHQAQKFAKQHGRFQKWGPTIVGLGLLPTLPFLFDSPVEKLTEYAWRNHWPYEKPPLHLHEQGPHDKKD